jgi:hypothetical protein
MRFRKKKLLLEQLEDRLTPSTTGVPWPDPGHLTLSFVPDGTKVGGTASDLFSLLGKQAPTAAWQTAILQAMETWASLVNMNVGIVADGGQPAGTPGAVQGDTRFGDIRVSAKPLANTALSTAEFFSYAGSTWSGDVQFSDIQSFGINASAPLDLYTLALHELGHSLGLKDNWTDPTSVEYGNYLGARTGLGPQDIADIVSLYGSRQPDAFDANKSNDGFGTATPVGNLSAQLAFDADITKPSDVDFYKITTPLALGLTKIHVQIQTAGYSLLTPTVSVFDASHRLVASDSATNPLDGNVDVYVPSALPLSTYYIEVSSATPAFAVGGYHANITYQAGLLSLGGLISTVNYVVDFGTNNLLKTATVLVPAIGAKSDARFDYLYHANIGSSSDVDYYQVQAPATNVAGTGWTMHTMVWAADSNMLRPQIHVFDVSGNPLQVQILNNGEGGYTIQATGFMPSSTYYIEVLAWNPLGANNVGNYALAVKFDMSAPVALDFLDSQTLTAAAPSTTGTLSIGQNQLFQFSLAAATVNGSQDATVTMDVYDSNGARILSLCAVAGRPPVTQLTYLTTGTYTVVYRAQSLSGKSLPDVVFWLDGADFSDPSGPYFTSAGTTTTTGSTGSGTDSGSSGGSTTYTSTKSTTGTTQPYYY